MLHHVLGLTPLRRKIWSIGGFMALVGTLLVSMTQFAYADAPNPNVPWQAQVTTDVDGNWVVTAKGIWDWETHSSDCNLDRFGVGWALDWDDPNQTGHEITNNKIPLTVHVGAVDPADTADAALAHNPYDNDVYYSQNPDGTIDPVTGVPYWHPTYCGTYDPVADYNNGIWGPLTHTYDKSVNLEDINICLVTYDIHWGQKPAKESDGTLKPGTGTPKAADLIAGGPGHAGDNSVEKNDFAFTTVCIDVPSITTTATDGNVGGTISDSAVLSGGSTDPAISGTITFNLYGPSDPTCAAAPIFTDVVTVNGNGTYNSAGYPVTVGGDYHWIAHYSGDARNASIGGECGDVGETSTVADPLPEISVTKSASPSQVPESLSGVPVTYTVVVTNTSATVPVTLTSLVDDKFGDLEAAGSTTCDLDPAVVLAVSNPGDTDTYTCTFVEDITLDFGSSHTNTVTATAVDANANQATDTDDATVTSSNVTSSMTVDKSANPTSVPESASGTDVTYTVVVTNTSSVDSITLTDLNDDIFGDLESATATTCDLDPAVVLAPSNPGDTDTYTCSFTGKVAGNAGDTHTNVVTATGVDDDGNTLTPTDDATVNVTNLASSISVTKTANPTSVPESATGTDVTYTVVVTNTSSVDNVDLVSLIDDKFGDLESATATTCDLDPTVTLAPTDTYSCTFTGSVAGNAGSSHKNIVTAGAVDDDENPLQAKDDAIVQITDVASSMTVTKTADPTSVPENNSGETVTYTVVVTNTSAVDSITLTDLDDDVFGDLESADNTTCDLSGPVVLAPGDDYSCTFTGVVTGDVGDTHTNIVTATGVDDDGNTLTPTDDADVTFSNVASSIQVTKTAGTASVPESGANVTYTVEVTNTSSVDTVTISSLVDDVFGNLDNQGTCEVTDPLVVLTPGGTYTCQFTGFVTGDAGETHVNEVTVVGVDDDGAVVEDDDTAEVDITDVPPTIQVTKQGGGEIAPPGGEATFTVRITNTSTELVTTTAITDSVDGGPDIDVTTVSDPITATTCDVGENIGPGNTYECQFTIFLEVEGDEGIIPDVVTAYAVDNEGNETFDDDDADTTVTGVDVRIRKGDGDATFVIGEQGTYTIQVQNVGSSSTFSKIQVRDILPDGLSYVSASGTGWTCSETDGVIVCETTATLDPGESAPVITIVVNVDADAPSLITNTAEVRTRGDQDPTNNVDSEDTPTEQVLEEEEEPEAEVLGDTIERLPTTGSESQRMAVFAGMLLLLGGLFVVASGEFAPVAYNLRHPQHLDRSKPLQWRRTKEPRHLK